MGKIRLLLALSVVAAHAAVPPHFTLVGGQMAVQLFYVISGFYMALILNGKYPPDGPGRRAFWQNRALRLAPCYFAVLLFTIGFSLWGPYRRAADPQFPLAWEVWRIHFHQLAPGAALWMALVNVTVVGQDSLSFLALNPASGHLVWSTHPGHDLVPAWQFAFIPQAWTLSLEAIFYVLAPWITRWPLRRLAVLIGASLGVRLVTYALAGIADPWTYRFFPSEIGVFALGIVAHRFYATPGLLTEAARRAAAAWVVAATLFAIVAYGPLTAVVPIWAFAALIPWIFRQSRSDGVDRWIGELSYPVYLVHLALLPVAVHFTTHFLHSSYPGLVLGIFSVAGAAAFVGTAEPTINRWRERRTARLLAAA